MPSSTASRSPAHPFHSCGSCKFVWPTWDRFVLDPGVRLLGMQSVVTHPQFNLLVFEHKCGSSVSILTRRLHHLLPEHEGGEPTSRLTDTELCSRHCRHLGDLEACDSPCVNARDRRLIQIIQRMRKDGSGTG